MDRNYPHNSYYPSSQKSNWKGRQQDNYPKSGVYTNNSSNRPYQGYGPQYNSTLSPSTPNHYYTPSPAPSSSGGSSRVGGTSYNSWNRKPYNRNDNYENKGKSKKKKKSLSQNVPAKKNWTREEAYRAWEVEREFHNASSNSLMIKFPDAELNRDIVSKLHPAIEVVNFPNKCSSRFCFITLKKTADTDKVINRLNQIPFGNGHLFVEYKKPRNEDDTGPDEIDPLTLYVGNLSPVVTKKDIREAYPNYHRTDIGYSKQMKNTRYAFITFSSVADSIQALQTTASKQMYSQSLIVRFRRLKGRHADHHPELSQYRESKSNMLTANTSFAEEETKTKPGMSSSSSF